MGIILWTGKSTFYRYEIRHAATWYINPQEIQNFYNYISDGDPENQFYIGHDTGALVVARPLDWEKKGVYNLTVQVTDGVNFDNCSVSKDWSVLMMSHAMFMRVLVDATRRCIYQCIYDCKKRRQNCFYSAVCLPAVCLPCAHNYTRMF